MAKTMGTITPPGGWDCSPQYRYAQHRYALPVKSHGLRNGLLLTLVLLLGAAKARTMLPWLSGRPLPPVNHAARGHTQDREPTQQRTLNLSPEDEQEMRKELKLRSSELQEAEAILNARSYTARVEAYCRSRVGNRASPMMGFSGLSGYEAEARYKELLLSESKTREEELARRRTLQALSSLVANYERNVQDCEAGVLNSFVKMESDNDLRMEIKQLKADILDIETNGLQISSSAATR